MKVCTYSCVYCQVGRTTRMEHDRRFFFEPRDVVEDVRSRLAEAKDAAEQVDYLAFVPDGEPTLDVNLGQEIALLKALDIPIGVITNSSLLWRDDVREDLCNADWVSVKIDSVQEATWRRIDRPHRALQLPRILDGIQTFASAFGGELVTETMLVSGLNDSDEGMRDIADFIDGLQPSRAYLSIPTRPPAERWVGAGPDRATLARMRQIFEDRVPRVEYLLDYEGDAFASTGDPEKDLLSITAVHPMRAEAVGKLLSQSGSSWDIVERLVARGDLTKSMHDAHTFYVRRSPQNRDVEEGQ